MERIRHIDTAKGILILMVVALHVAYIYNSSRVGGSNDVFLLITKTASFLYTSYFMAAFFLLHGYCSRRKRTVKEAFEYGSKTLIIPAFVLNYKHLQWFCVAMLGGIMIRAALRKKTDRTCWTVYAALFLAGILTHRFCDEPYLSRIMIYAPYIFIGEKCRAVVESRKFAALSVAACLALWATYALRGDYMLPQATGDYFTFGFREAPAFLIASICGSSVVFMLARLLQRVDTLAAIGRRSLVIFLFHFTIVLVVERLSRPYLDDAGTAVSLAAFCMIFAVTLTGSYALATLIEKRAPWLTGKGWG